MKCRLFSLAFDAHRNSYGGKIASEQGVVKVKCSWVTEGTPSQKFIRYFLHPPYPYLDVHVCLPVGKTCVYS